MTSFFSVSHIGYDMNTCSCSSCKTYSLISGRCYFVAVGLYVFMCGLVCCDGLFMVVIICDWVEWGTCDISSESVWYFLLSGDTGTKGNLGRDGSVGPKGDAGMKGEQGIKGTPGLKGEPVRNTFCLFFCQFLMENVLYTERPNINKLNGI